MGERLSRREALKKVGTVTVSVFALGSIDRLSRAIADELAAAPPVVNCQVNAIYECFARYNCPGGGNYCPSSYMCSAAAPFAGCSSAGPTVVEVACYSGAANGNEFTCTRSTLSNDPFTCSEYSLFRCNTGTLVNNGEFICGGTPGNNPEFNCKASTGKIVCDAGKFTCYNNPAGDTEYFCGVTGYHC